MQNVLEFLEFLNQNAGVLTLVFTGIVALATAVYATLDGPFRFCVTANYLTPTNDTVSRRFDLDLLHLLGMVQLGTPPLKEVADSLKAIKTDLHHVVTGFNRLAVDVRTRDERQQEEAEEIRASTLWFLPTVRVWRGLSR